MFNDNTETILGGLQKPTVWTAKTSKDCISCKEKLRASIAQEMRKGLEKTMQPVIHSSHHAWDGFVIGKDEWQQFWQKYEVK